MTSSLPMLQVRNYQAGTIFRQAGFAYLVDGTAYPGAPNPTNCIYPDGSGYWCGFSSGIAGGLMVVADGLWQHRFIGYSAPILGMNTGVIQGAMHLGNSIELDAQLWRNAHGGNMTGFAAIISGYSQGAMVVMYWLLNYVLKPGAPQAYLLPYLYRLYLFGDPYRYPGIAHGNALIGMSESIFTDGVETGGIGCIQDYTIEIANMKAPDDAWLIMSCANQGDIYACCPIGLDPTKPAAPGKTANLIFNEITQPGIKNTVSIAKALFTPVGTVEEIFNGMKFAAQGTNAPHWQYFSQMNGCIDDAKALGERLLAA
jgi:hypothetical protein